MTKRLMLAALLVLGLAGPAQAQQALQNADNYVNAAGTVLTRPNNTTAYGAAALVCASTGVACTPQTVNALPSGWGHNIANRVTLLKSGSSTTSATFAIWAFSQAPSTVCGSTTLFDATAYVGPCAADMPYYLGQAQCSTPVATSDSTAQVWYECTWQNPNTSGATPFTNTTNPASQLVYYYVSTTAAYTPAANEKFSVWFSGLY